MPLPAILMIQGYLGYRKEVPIDLRGISGPRRIKCQLLWQSDSGRGNGFEGQLKRCQLVSF